MAEKFTQERLEEIMLAVKRHAGNYTEAADELGISRHSVGRAMRRLGVEQARDIVEGRVKPEPRRKLELPEAGKIARYIFTAAQSNTNVHDGVWENLTALAAVYDAQIVVSRFTYMKEAYGAKSVKPGKGATAKDKADLWFDARIEPFVCDEGIEVAPGLVFCGEMQISPTAVRPLSGLESYTGRKSSIFPHPKIAMESVPSAKHEPTKLMFTTGAVTLRNYIAKKAGQRAEFHHSYGGLLVEVDSEGNWWCRQLNADSEGTIYDLTLRAAGGKVTGGHRVKAINWGDIHVGTVPKPVFEACWGGEGMLAELDPEFQFVHDLLDFRAQNHHDRGNHHSRFAKWIAGKSSVAKEMLEVVEFLQDIKTPGVETIVVDSNHDNAFKRWLREADYRADPENAILFLESQLQVYKAIAADDKDFHVVEWAVKRISEDPELAKFLRCDESFVICHDANGGIECGMHGHLGANGAKPSQTGFAKMGRKSNLGHTHSASIYDGVYTAGVLGDLDQGYNVGPSSWTHSNIVTYATGKRAIITIWKGRWRA